LIIRDKNGTERIAMPYDFQDVTITFTPSEWNELRDIFSFHKKKIKPNAFAKINQRILEKLEANQPALKEGYEKVQDGWPSISNEQETE
jgi:hypothetical protein